MNKQIEQSFLIEIYSEIPVLRPSDLELSEMFSYLFSENKSNLPHDYDQSVDYPIQNEKLSVCKVDNSNLKMKCCNK